jgi:hypothetical protein
MAALLDKTTILNKIETEYRAFEDLLAPLDGWQLTTPGVVGEGSIKDLLAHLTVWQKRLLTILQAALQGTEPAQPIARSTEEEIECLHQQFYAAARARPLREVWEAFRSTYLQVKHAVEALSEETLLDCERFAWLDGIALQRFIADNTYQHYEDHALAVYAWLAAA